jgi:myo-inositol-1(or 4)-monophosphatase
VAAGGLLVREAGGRVSDRTGGDAWRSGRALVATNGRIHDALLALLAAAKPRRPLGRVG